MAKFVHVEAAKVRSGMRKLEELRADDTEWTAERQRLKEEADEIRRRRDRDHLLETEQAGSGRVDDHPIFPDGESIEPAGAD